MRKYAFLLVIILVLGLMTACSANGTSPTNSDTTTATEEPTSTVISESPTSTAESEPTATATSEPTKTPSQAAASEAPTPAPDNSSKPTDPPKTDTPMEPSKPAVSTAPAVTPSQPTTSTPPTEPPVTLTPPPIPAFDINDWITFAKSYGQQIGLIYDAGTTGSWDNPIAAGATLKSTENNIKNRLDRYKQDGIQYFSVWAEKRTDGSEKYDIYIGYA